jgi:biotin carboxyl carrier protein
MKYVTTIGNEQFTIEINQSGEITLNGGVINVDMKKVEDTTMYSMLLDGESHDIRMNEGDGFYEVQVSGDIYRVIVEDERTRLLAEISGETEDGTGEVHIKAPMPGVVVDVAVTPGQKVIKEDIVVVLESMKMQNEFKAPRDGEVRVVRVKPGDTVDRNEVMLSIV